MTLAHAHAEPSNPARVVVLGAGGFFGRRLMAACAAAGIEATGLGTRDIDLAEPGAGARLAERLRGGDVLVFLSALTPDKGRDTATLMKNVAMGRAVCEATRAVELAQLVYASSDAVYSFATSLVSEDTPAIPLDLYGAMHRTRELMLAAEAKAPTAVVRFTAIYGAGNTHDSYGPNRFLRQALKEGRIALFGDGEEMRDHLHIDDAAALTLKLIVHGSTGLINAASGRSESFRKVAELTAACVGGNVRIEPSPRANPATFRHFDTTVLLRAFPGMRFTPLAEGLAQMRAATGSGARG
jgi:nucleoside-diphosphate-sugar epimerase